MDPHLQAMNAGKANSSFSVKDILDLPKGKQSTITAGSLSGIAAVPEVPDLPSVTGYYDSDNPYTRWLQNNEHINYPGTYSSAIAGVLPFTAKVVPSAHNQSGICGANCSRVNFIYILNNECAFHVEQ